MNKSKLATFCPAKRFRLKRSCNSSSMRHVQRSGEHLRLWKTWDSCKTNQESGGRSHVSVIDRTPKLQIHGNASFPSVHGGCKAPGQRWAHVL